MENNRSEKVCSNKNYDSANKSFQHLVCIGMFSSLANQRLAADLDSGTRRARTQDQLGLKSLEVRLTEQTIALRAHVCVCACMHMHMYIHMHKHLGMCTQMCIIAVVLTPFLS